MVVVTRSRAAARLEQEKGTGSATDDGIVDAAVPIVTPDPPLSIDKGDVVYPLRRISEGVFEMESFWNWRPGRKRSWFPRDRNETVTDLGITVPSQVLCDTAAHWGNVRNVGWHIAVQLMF
jgi:hypothetical protein